MKIEQVQEIVKSLHKQIVGEELAEVDTSKIVDIGKTILESTNIDNYVKALTDTIGKIVFVNRPYQGNGSKVLMESWEFGSILEKVDCEIPDTSVSSNDTWGLTDQAEYKQDTFYKPTVTAKLYSNKITFEIDVSFTERQVKGSFNSMNELNAFISMIHTAVERAFTVKLDGLIMATINNYIAKTLHNEISDKAYSTKSTVKAVNLYKLYKDNGGTVAGDFMTDTGFLKFASMTINNYISRMSKLSTLFNIEGKQRFTPKDDLNIIMLDVFKSSCGSYLEADTFNKELVSLPNSETVPYWQGSGVDYSFDKTSSINVKIDGTNVINADGILCVMFDKNAIGVCNQDKRVTTHYNAKGEFFNNFYKFDCGYFNDFSENFVVFFAKKEEVSV